MQHRSAVCLSVDRLQAMALGAYGNTTFSTPQLDRLAAESFLFDQMIVDRVDLPGLFDGFCQGRGPFDGDRLSTDPVLLTETLGTAGVKTILVTDDPSLTTANAFDEYIRVDHPPCDRAATDVEQTELFRFFAAASDAVRLAHRPCLLWIHSRGMAGSWDAPNEFRRQFAEEDDPCPPDFVQPPNRHMTPDEDPDHLLGVRFAYAAQVVLLDIALGAFLDALKDNPLGEETLLAFAGVRGLPLGEHNRIGPCDEALYGELVHAPLMIHMPQDEGATCRELGFVQPTDLSATLADWWGLGQAGMSPLSQSLLPIIRGQAVSKRDRACIRGSGEERAARTAAWYLRKHEHGAQLYRKPDDRCEVNDIISRCQDVGERLFEMLENFADANKCGDASRLRPLEAVLAEGLD